MSYLALYRKYRPNSFDEMVGQNNVVKVIRNAIMNNKISHAYLFSGPRGTGKTTTAKIIAKMVNCLDLKDGVPCGKCDSCKIINASNDIVEIDAASNNGVDEIREIREKVNLVPSELKYKIYIIDEVHMLTTQAFNALLKTLEEPPEHVIFILATTEFYKIPLTIVSRCQRFQFSKIDAESMVNNLKRIADSEKIEVDDGVLYEIARMSDGCCRDAVNLFDQLISYSSKNINIEQLYEICGSVSFADYSELINCILNNDNVGIINYCEKINSDGKNIFKFVEEFMFFLRDIISYKLGVNNLKIKDKIIIVEDFSKKFSFDCLYYFINGLNELLVKIKLSSYPYILLTVFLLKMSKDLSNFDVIINKEYKKNIENIEDKTNLTVNVENEIVEDNNVNVNIVNLSDEDINIRINNTFASASKDYLNLFKEKLKSVDNAFINSSYSFVVGVIKDCKPVVASKDYLVLSAGYDSLVDRVNNIYEDIENFLNDLFGYHVNVVAISDERWKIEKDKYITNLKKGIKYEYKDIVNNLGNSKKVVKKNDQSDLDILKDLVGNDIIECVN